MRHALQDDGTEADPVSGVDDGRPQGLIGRPVGGDPAARQHDHPVGKSRGEPEVVQAHHHAGAARGLGAQHRHGVQRIGRIEAGHRLVGQQDLGLGGERAGQQQARALALRQGIDRSIGEGKPIVLCTRFRGNLDQWDPAFLDALAANGFRVITFDYSGLGLSTGTATYNPFLMVKDPLDLMEALGLHELVFAGWSIGGLVAQIALTNFPDRISHGVLIATSPPGPLVKLAEPLFYDLSSRPDNTFEDSVALFFEPRSPASREAARDTLP